MDKVLILDDCVERFPRLEAYAKTCTPKPEIFKCTTAEEAMHLLVIHHFAVIFLDHDLGGEVYCDSSSPNTGAEVARFIVRNHCTYDKCIIHSMNYAGAEAIRTILNNPKVVYMPFTILTLGLW